MRNDQILFLVTVNLKYSFCYNCETLLEKHAKRNQQTQYVCYNRVLVITESDFTYIYKFHLKTLI